MIAASGGSSTMFKVRGALLPKGNHKKSQLSVAGTYTNCVMLQEYGEDGTFNRWWAQAEFNRVQTLCMALWSNVHEKFQIPEYDISLAAGGKVRQKNSHSPIHCENILKNSSKGFGGVLLGGVT